MTGNQQDAEDVVQDSFLRAYKQLARFDERASFGTWLYRIAVNCSLDLVRSRKRRNELMTPEDRKWTIPSSPSLARPHAGSRCHEWTGPRPGGGGQTELSASERTAFVLRHFEGMCIEDVSRVLGCQPGAASTAYFAPCRN